MTRTSVSLLLKWGNFRGGGRHHGNLRPALHLQLVLNRFLPYEFCELFDRDLGVMAGFPRELEQFRGSPIIIASPGWTESAYTSASAFHFRKNKIQA